MLLTGVRIVTPTGIIERGWIEVAGDRIAGVGSGEPVDSAADQVPAERTDLTGRTVLPGFIDLHLHGGGGATFDEGEASILHGLHTHRRCGTTRALVSLVSAPVADMVSRIGVAAAVEDPMILGLHLEGPFLSHTRRGVHDPAALIGPDPAVLDRLLAAGGGRVRTVTVAPELDGGLDLVKQLVTADVHAAVGHSDADYATATAAFELGADLVTHAFNGMRPLHHRDPAIIGAAMDADVVLEVINDGVHLHNTVVGMLHRIAPERIALITDAMGAACAADGRYRLGAFDVEVLDRVARLTADGTIAGSTLTMDTAVRRAVSDIGMDLVAAVNAASLVPATLLGLGDRVGSLTPGRLADLVITDHDLVVEAVHTEGVWVDGRRPAPAVPA
ncbi:N-acetylglucosamine-6-phosphate deacetylase [Nakamurella silvestris]|nr:N-acetylglucosamine-6-phosphate deacetylase [Nakamurella silvestris]